MTITYPCPQCRKPSVWTENPHRPFCCERCKLLDLGAWASEEYSIQGTELPFFEEVNGVVDEQD